MRKILAQRQNPDEAGAIRNSEPRHPIHVLAKSILPTTLIICTIKYS